MSEELIKLLCTKFQSQIEVILFCNNSLQSSYLRKDPIFSLARIIVLPSVKGKWLRSSRQYFKYAFSYKSFEIDILHFLVPRFYPFFWLFPAKKFVCTFHAGGDVTANKDNFVLSREIYNFIARFSHKKLNLVIAVSNYGSKEISQVYGIPSHRISVIHPGTDDLWKIIPITKEHNRIDKKKLVVVIGRWQKYKNVQVVSSALVNASQSELNDYYFLFVGKQISTNAKLIESNLRKLDERLYGTVNYLNEQDYVNTISNAELVIVPSLNEGFSLPVFDAFALGTRVMFHNPSPPSQILIGQKGVFATDLSSSNNLLTKISNAIKEDSGSVVQNREFLISIGATWESLAENYVISYKRLMK